MPKPIRTAVAIDLSEVAIIILEAVLQLKRPENLTPAQILNNCPADYADRAQSAADRVTSYILAQLDDEKPVDEIVKEFEP